MPAPAPRAVEPLHSDSGGEAGSWLSPGRVIRVPAGYLFFAAAGVVLIFVLGWTLGHRQATAHAQRAEAARQAEQWPVSDPLLAEAPLNPGLIAANTSPQADSGSSRKAAAPGRAPASAPTAGGDPRVSGLNYYIVARYDAPTAERAAEFLTRHGLAAGAFPDNNPRLYLVVVLRGFPGGELDSAEARQVRQEIARLGRLWKGEERGPSDFSDAYPAKH